TRGFAVPGGAASPAAAAPAPDAAPADGRAPPPPAPRWPRPPARPVPGPRGGGPRTAPRRTRAGPATRSPRGRRPRPAPTPSEPPAHAGARGDLADGVVKALAAADHPLAEHLEPAGDPGGGVERDRVRIQHGGIPAGADLPRQPAGVAEADVVRSLAAEV